MSIFKRKEAGHGWLNRSRATVKRLRRRRVPVLLQLSAVECGAACLAMILSYYGRKTLVSETRERCSVGRDGATARTIARVARSYGLRVRAYSGEPVDFKYVPLPAIVHWNFNHFVVVERWSPHQVDIVDPAGGRRRLTPSEFDVGFTGVILTFEPSIHFERRGKVQRTAWHSYLKQIVLTPGMLRVLFQILGASLLLQAFGLGLPLFTKVLVDHVLPFQMTNVMLPLGIGLLIVVLAQMLLQYLRAALLIYLQARLDAHLMLGFFEHVLSLPFRFFQTRSSGDLLMRLGSNSMIRELLSNQTVSLILDGVFVFVYLVILLTQDISFSLFVLGIGLLQIILLLSTTRRVHDLMERDLSAQAEAQGYLVEALTGIETLKASGVEARALDRWSNLFFKQLNVSLQRNQLSALIGTAMTALRTLSPLILLWWGTLRVLDGTLSLGTMLALNALAASFLTPLASLVSSGQQIQLVGAHLDRISDVLEAEPEQDSQAVREAPPLTGRIDLQHVSFRYDANVPWVLRDVSLSIEPGQKVAIVGPTGSGKTTLGLLLLGLYPPTEGEILYDGIPLPDLEYRSLRSQFGVVLQQPFLFNGSIRQNIAFNDPDLPLDQVSQMAQLAVIHDDIVQMPMGYETLVAEGGSALSGGQRQRLALARALAHQPVVLLLDEATSHLDAVTEKQVDQNLSALHCTRIVIAHRLSTIQNADLILVLDQGVVVERGTDEDLLAQDGRYAALVRSQLRIDTLETNALMAVEFESL